jgi:hypothetical protein
LDLAIGGCILFAQVAVFTYVTFTLQRRPTAGRHRSGLYVVAGG